MPNFAYVALDARAGENRGLLEVASQTEACRRLKEMGFFPTRVIEQADRPGRHAPVRPARNAAAPRLAALRSLTRRLGGRVKPAVVTAFTRQVATLVEAGLPLLRGLRLLEEQETHPAFRRVLCGLIVSIEEGASFSEALAQHPRVFNRLYVSMVQAGEVAGALETVLRRLAEFMEKAARIKAKVLAALYYPVTVMVVAVLILSLLMVYVLPRFREVFTDLLNGAPLPAFTRFVLGLSTAVRDHFLIAAALGIGLAVLVKLLLRTPVGREAWDRLKLRLPVLGPVFTKAAVARFTRTLGTLLGSGVPILQALTIVKDTAGNVVVQKTVAAVHEGVKEGESLTAPLKASGVFPPVVVGMVDVGEQTGALPDMLLKIADNYDEEVDNAAAAMTSLLEPILLVFLAILVGSIVIAMFLPIIQIVRFIDGGPHDGGG
jgi:type IV pilus assembly protein PilC